MMVQTGLDVLLGERRDRVAGFRVGLICNAASVDASLTHSLDRITQEREIEVRAVFGPQHGLSAETQDNMIEWEAALDQASGPQVYSLYGERRGPSAEMLADLDVLVFDLQDVGARYYTFIWTMALAMEACAEHGKRFLVLDRPNPLGGRAVEGNVSSSRFRSFVGLYPLAARHGMTIGEIALYLNSEFDLGCDLEVVPMIGWRRAMSFEETGLPWVMPSPNMPTLKTALVYPGLALLEGTNVSEGRGTTRPFEISGAPWIDERRLAARLGELAIRGAVYRPLRFIPTFHKWSGESIGGVQIHVLDRKAFNPFLCGLGLIKAYRELSEGRFEWKAPPYEYEFRKLPIDVLCGTDEIRLAIEAGRSLEEMQGGWGDELRRFAALREKYLLYEE